MTPETKMVIRNLSELLQAKAPRGVLILEGDLTTWKDDGTQEGSLTKTWAEALDYIRRECDRLSIPYFSLSSIEFEQANSMESEELKKMIQNGIKSRYDLGLYVAGCFCCIDSNDSYRANLRRLGNLFGSDRVFIASSLRGQNAPRKAIANLPKDSYFLV